MKRSRATTSLVVFLLLLPPASFAQEWRRISPIVAGYRDTKLENYLAFKTIVFDSATSSFYTHTGKTIVQSDARGLDWEALAFPQIWTISSSLRINSSIGQLYASWFDKSRSSSESRLARYVVGRREWEIITPVELQPFVPVGVIDSLVFACRGFGATTDTAFFSADFGVTWRNEMFAQTFGRSERGYIEPDEGIISFRSTEIGAYDQWFELRSGSVSLDKVLLPIYTEAYCYTDTNTTIAGVVDYRTKNRVAISHDQGKNWVFLDSLTCVNSSLILKGNGRNYEAKQIKSWNKNHASIWFASGHVVSTTNNGATWWDRTAGLPATRAHPLRWDEETHIVEHQDGAYSFPYMGRLRILPADVTKSVEEHGDRVGISTLAFGNGVYIAGTYFGLLRSSDSGTTWYQTGVVPEILAPSNESSLFRGQNAVIIDQIFPQDSLTVYGACTFTGNIVSWDAGQKSWRANGYISTSYLESPSPRLESDDYYSNTDICSFQQKLIEVTPEGVVWNSGTTIDQLTHTSVLSNSTSPGADRWTDAGISAYIKLDSLTHFATQDSLCLTYDGGATWITGGRGLPTQKSSNIVPCGGIVRLSNGNLVAGFRGSLEQTDTSDIPLYKGGFYVSSDQGLSWTAQNTGLDSNICVWFMHQVPDSDTILASVGTIVRLINFTEDSPKKRYNMSDARIIRSTDGGDSWQDVFLETRQRSGYTGRREIISHPDGRVLAATIESGVIESTDKGATWRTLGDESLLGVFVNDIAIDTMGLVYASTNQGVFYYVPSTTSVNEPISGIRTTTLFAYPTPAKGVLTVRVNNINLRKSWRSLKLYNRYGGIELELSSALNRAVYSQPSATQHEFSFNADILPIGVYLLVLDTPSGSETMKILVSEY